MVHGPWFHIRQTEVHWFGTGRQAGSIVAPSGRVALSRVKLLGVGHRDGQAMSL